MSWDEVHKHLFSFPRLEDMGLPPSFSGDAWSSTVYSLIGKNATLLPARLRDGILDSLSLFVAEAPGEASLYAVWFLIRRLGPAVSYRMPLDVYFTNDTEASGIVFRCFRQAAYTINKKSRNAALLMKGWRCLRSRQRWLM